MVKTLSFKGEKKPSGKRKRTTGHAGDEQDAGPILQTNAADALVEDDGSWVSADAVTDISGPVILAFVKQPFTYLLACDALGKVFASSHEGTNGGDPEPHDVRQVWVANRVVGSADRFTLKGHHGRYLGCDKYGVLFATAEAVSQQETFRARPAFTEPGTYDFQTWQDSFLSIQTSSSVDERPDPRGDSISTSDSTGICVRMQARFKPKLQVAKAEKIRAKITRAELEEEVGRRLDDDEVKRLKRARRDGSFYETMLDVKVKGKHDKFA